MVTFKELYETLPLIVKLKLIDLKELGERNDYHPEDNTYEHIKIVIERCIKTEDPDLIMTALFHDICKLDAAKRIPENKYHTDYIWFVDHLKSGLKTYGHDVLAVDLAERYKYFIEGFGANIDNVKFLVGEHTRIKQLSKMKKAKADKLRNHPLFEKLSIFTDADNMLKEFTHGKN